MNELDCVKLIKPFKKLKVGTKGCIVSLSMICPKKVF